jgi:hypothetical protein
MAKPNIINNPAILVFASTIVGYGLAFAYEFGYLGYYKIPANFIQISPLQIAFGSIFALVTITIVDIAVGIAEAIRLSLTPRNVINRAKIDVGVVTMLLIVGLIFLPPNINNGSSRGVSSLVLIGVYLLLVVLMFLRPFILYRKYKNWEQSLKQSYEESDKAFWEQNNAKSNSSVRIELRIIPQFFKPGLFILVLIIACGVFGNSSANIDNRYVTIIRSKSEAKEIVVRQYNDNLLVKTFDTKTMKLKNGFSTKSAIGNSYDTTVLKCTKDVLSSTTETPIKQACPKP